MDLHSIQVGELWRSFDVTARSGLSPITSGTVNYYCKCLTGTNAGKWWKDSDQTWATTETANAMTHQADGHWTITLTASPFFKGILYLEYAKESADLHVPQSYLLSGTNAVIDSASNEAV